MADEEDTVVDDAALGGGDGADDAPQLTEVEQIASGMGWKPKDQFQGPQDQWRPASDFLRRIPGSRDLKRELRHVREELGRQSETSAKITDRLLREQQEKLEAKFNEAFEAGDKQGAAKAVSELKDLAAEKDKPAKRDTSSEDDFASRNPWYGTDARATRYAVSLSQELAEQGKSHEEQLEAVERDVRETFPHLFDAPAPKPRQSQVAPPSRSTGAPRAKGFNDLPPEARRACENLADAAHTRFGKDRKQTTDAYVAEYFKNSQAA